MKIEVCLLLVSDSVAFAVDCTVSRTVIQLFTQSLVTCVLNWCRVSSMV